MQSKQDLETSTYREREYLDILQRTQADFINYKHRAERQQREQFEFAKADLILKLLPVLDDIQHSQRATPLHLAEADWAKGMELIKRKLETIFEEEGLSKIDAQGRCFDPREHEAVSYEESDQYEEGVVKTVYRDGYQLNGRVIRPAQVEVSKGEGKEGSFKINKCFG